jgi:hypothetical protein
LQDVRSDGFNSATAARAEEAIASPMFLTPIPLLRVVAIVLFYRG